MMSEEEIQAYVDGVLPPEEAARMLIYLADHPAEQARVDALMALNETLARAYEAPLHEPVPQAIHDTIMGRGRVLRFPAARRAAPFMAGLGAIAAAAAMALFLLPGETGQSHIALGPVKPGSTLEAALEGGLSGARFALEDAAELTLIASFQTPAYGICREVERQSGSAPQLETAIACRTDAGWSVTIASAAQTAPQAQGFAPASGTTDRVSAFLNAAQAGFALSAAEERAAKARGWRSP